MARDGFVDGYWRDYLRAYSPCVSGGPGVPKPKPRKMASSSLAPTGVVSGGGLQYDTLWGLVAGLPLHRDDKVRLRHGLPLMIGLRRQRTGGQFA